MNTVSFCTLGCKVNQYESEAMAKLFEDAGYIVKDFGEICDVYVINTCTVTSMSDRKSRQMINRAKKANPNAVIAVAGCYSQVSPEEVEKIDGVSIVLGTSSKNKIVDLVQKAIKEKEYIEEKKHIVSVKNIMKQKDYEDMWVSSYSSKTRAFVKIEDGCSEFCTYCIIPYARGPVRSRSIESIKKEVTALCENGFKEIVLTGIHIASYGKDTKTHTLLDVIKVINEVEGIERIRLGSLEPRILTEAFIEELSKIKKVCNHFHISLQSGCDKTLERMNRKYTTDEYFKSVCLLRKYFKDPAIATDVMVGFPGETEEEFESSLDFVKKVGFADAHVFAYSNRKGTKADVMRNQVHKTEKERRSKIMTDCVDELKIRYMDKFLNTDNEILAEKKVKHGIYEGHMANYIKVHIKSDEDISRKMIKARITKREMDYLLAEI